MASILVIEDNELLREEVAATLEDANHEVLSVEDGEQALALAPPQPSWNLVVTDVRLPGRYNGPETMRLLRQRHNTQLPFVVMTGFADLSVPFLSARLQAYDYIYKPFHPSELLQAVERSLGRGGALRWALDCFHKLAGRRGKQVSPAQKPAGLARLDCLQQMYLLIRSRSLRTTGLALWDELERLEANWLAGETEEAAYRLLQQQILAAQEQQKLRSPSSLRDGKTESRLYYQFHDRVEKGEINDQTFFLACSARLATESERQQTPELEAVYQKCWL